MKVCSESMCQSSMENAIAKKVTANSLNTLNRLIPLGGGGGGWGGRFVERGEEGNLTMDSSY